MYGISKTIEVEPGKLLAEKWQLTAAVFLNIEYT